MVKLVAPTIINIDSMMYTGVVKSDSKPVIGRNPAVEIQVKARLNELNIETPASISRRAKTSVKIT